MKLTIDDKFKASKSFWPDALIRNLSVVFWEAGFEVDAEKVLREIHSNSYRLMEEMKTEVDNDCDPFYEEFPFLMYGNGITIYESDQLFLFRSQEYLRGLKDPQLNWLKTFRFF